MTEIHFDLKGEPFAKQSFRFATMHSKTGKTFMVKYQPKKVKDGERNLRSQIIQQLPEGFVPFSKMVHVKNCAFRFTLLKSFTKTKLAELDATGFIVKTTKPDLTDNLMKGLFDAMKGIVFTDDSIVWAVDGVRKAYSKIPGIWVTLEGE